jgi:phage terminase large subunit
MRKEWLGSQFLAEAEYIRKRHPEVYRHEYLGEVTGGGGEVFCNLTLREISEEEIAAFDRISRGLDWGYAVDPLHYTVNHYDRTRHRMYIFRELRARGMSNRRLAEEIRKENPNGREVICDSAEPKSIAEMREYGIMAVGAKKGPDSVYYGIKWLQDLEEIIIDPKRCPETAREFSGYEYEEDGRGGWKAVFPDRENHAIDAVRYSRENEMRHIRVR